jgi:hypothetical protein
MGDYLGILSDIFLQKDCLGPAHGTGTSAAKQKYEHPARMKQAGVHVIERAG